jgi:ketosteroid isomerase-like protein
MIGRPWALAVVGAVVLPLGVFAQGSIEAAAREVRRLEDDLTKALLERDVSALDRLWHDDLIFIARNGAQSTKSERIAGQGSSPRQPGETNVNDGVNVRIVGDTAITTVVSTWTFPSDSGPVPGRYRALHIWILDNGRWQLLAAQVAMLAQ